MFGDFGMVTPRLRPFGYGSASLQTDVLAIKRVAPMSKGDHESGLVGPVHLQIPVGSGLSFCVAQDRPHHGGGEAAAGQIVGAWTAQRLARLERAAPSPAAGWTHRYRVGAPWVGSPADGRGASDVAGCCYGRLMDRLPKLTVAEMERMTPDERARAVRERQLRSLGELAPEFRQRVEGTGRQLMKERGLLDVEHG